jgi:hypothetical protein
VLNFDTFPLPSKLSKGVSNSREAQTEQERLVGHRAGYA